MRQANSEAFLKLLIKLFCALFVFSISVTGQVSAEVNYHPIRKAVAIDDIYPVKSFDDWHVSCLKQDLGEDRCFAFTEILDLENALWLDFEIWPYPFHEEPEANYVDVNIAPRAEVDIVSVSEAEHLHICAPLSDYTRDKSWSAYA